MVRTYVKITNDLNSEYAMQLLKCMGNGGCCLLIGTVGDLKSEEGVTHLEYEGYEEMAIKQMRNVAIKAAERYHLNTAVIWHSLGYKKASDRTFLVGAGGPDQKAVFTACQAIVEELKDQVPIWKKMHSEHNNSWANAHH